jgi:ABC-2 type transport system permease protein
MKLLSTYFKEMKIASRGFYFYIEVFMAVIILIILLAAVDENPVSKSREYLFYDMPQEMLDYLNEKNISEGKMRYGEDSEIKLKPIAFEALNEVTGEIVSYNFKNEAVIKLKTMEVLNPNTGELSKTIYLVDKEEDMIRIAYSEIEIGATVRMDASGNFAYVYYMQGYETERLENLLYILHNETPDTVEAMRDNQVVRTLDVFDKLNSRENLIPMMIVFMGSLMGFFIVMAYVFLDKAEGVIRAFAVTPSAVWKYLLTKIFVILTTVIFSTSIITIPIMGAGPNYLMLYLFLIITTFAMASVGLLIASFFDSITKSFGAMYSLMIALLLPAFSYFIPSFDPAWLRFFPTYPMLQGMKEILLNGDMNYVLIYSAVFLVGGFAVFLLANIKFKKTLTV